MLSQVVRPSHSITHSLTHPPTHHSLTHSLHQLRLSQLSLSFSPTTTTSTSRSTFGILYHFQPSQTHPTPSFAVSSSLRTHLQAWATRRPMRTGRPRAPATVAAAAARGGPLTCDSRCLSAVHPTSLRSHPTQLPPQLRAPDRHGGASRSNCRISTSCRLPPPRPSPLRL
jgi:hypothetical protein